MDGMVWRRSETAHATIPPSLVAPRFTTLDAAYSAGALLPPAGARTAGGRHRCQPLSVSRASTPHLRTRHTCTRSAGLAAGCDRREKDATPAVAAYRY